MKKLLSLAVVAAASVYSTANAGQFTLQGGPIDGTTRFSVGYTADSIYTNGNFRVLPVYELARLHTDHGNGVYDNTLWQVSAVPMLRYYFTDLYVEAGIGVSLFNHVHFGEKSISTAFQFSDHIGVGYQITPAVSVGYRFSHFSNAGIKHPNSGINAQAIVLGVSF